MTFEYRFNNHDIPVGSQVEGRLGMRLVAALAKLLGRKYPQGMGISRARPAGYVPPMPRPEGIESYAGRWVAVAHGKVIAAADTSQELAKTMRALGTEADDAAMQFVRPPVAGYIIGVG